MKIQLVAFAATVAAASAQTTYQVPLNYNFNGIVHAGEAGLPDDPLGYRSISDRGLDFSAGIPADPLLSTYSLVGTAGDLDIVHLGDRNAVDGGNWAFDAAPDMDNIGVQPSWLPSSDQTGPQTSMIAAPILLEAVSTASFLFQVSNGGGAFDVEFDFATAPSFTATLSAGDWFGGAFAGTDSVDFANPGNSLSIAEGVVDLSAFAGDSLMAITFRDRTNTNAGYAILAAKVETDPVVTVTSTCHLPLAYNFNGIAHAGETGLPDDPDGYRSISDRGLDFTGGVPSTTTLDAYRIVDAPGVLDIVHLGNRNLTAGGSWTFDAAPDGDDIGIQPNWLTDVDQSGPQMSPVPPVGLTVSSEASFLYQISNGGGTFDVTFHFQGGGSVVSTLQGNDWFGGSLPGTQAIDSASVGANLSLTEGTVDLSASAGEILVGVSFSNASNANAGYAIVAANLTGASIGTEVCAGAQNSSGAAANFTIQGSEAAADNALCFAVTGLPSGSTGYFLNSLETILVPTPFGAQGDLCIGSFQMGRHNAHVLSTGTGDSVSFAPDLAAIPRPMGAVQAMAGETWYWQYWYRDMNPGATSNFSSARCVVFQ